MSSHEAQSLNEKLDFYFLYGWCRPRISSSTSSWIMGRPRDSEASRVTPKKPSNGSSVSHMSRSRLGRWAGAHRGNPPRRAKPEWQGPGGVDKVSQLHLLSRSHVRPGDTERKTGMTESLDRCWAVVTPRRKLRDLINSVGAVRAGRKEEVGEGQRTTMRKLKMTVDENPKCRVLRRDCGNGGGMEISSKWW